MPSYAVYSVAGQPNFGFRRTYVGALNVDLWDAGTIPRDRVERAVKNRVEVHFHGPFPKSAAAWLRPCTSPSEPVILHVCEDKCEAMRAELYYTLMGMEHSLSDIFNNFYSF